VAVGIVLGEGARVSALERWHSSEVDVRIDPAIGREVEAFIKKHAVRSVVRSPGIIGCPHEEGVDYEGEYCPLWAQAARSASLGGAGASLQRAH